MPRSKSKPKTASRTTVAPSPWPAPVIRNSATSQFFINVKDNANLTYPSFDGHGYAVFGKVTKGLEICDAIVSVPTGRVGPHGDVPSEPILIKSVKVGE
jgi:cyclophilin family peptidyl-prolyl cis-trans isomerase